MFQHNEHETNAVHLAITYVTSVVAIGTLIYLFITNKWLFYVFGFIVFSCCLAIVIEFTIRRITRHTLNEIPEHGLYAKPMIGKHITVKPVNAIATHDTTVKALPNPIIPTLAEMLAKDMFDNNIMFFGYQINTAKELVPVTGIFNDIRTFAILGKGGSGKTIRLFFLLIQVILSNGVIYLCDPHLMKIGSITRLLVPLAKWVKFAVPLEYLDNEYRKIHPLTEDVLNGFIMSTVAEFKNKMERRVHGEENDLTPNVLVIDEFARMMYNEQYGDICVDTIVSCANQYRDLQGYSVIVMHELVATNNQKTKNLVARLRKALHAVFIMRTDKDYAKYFVDNKLATKTTKLKTGMTILLDTNGETHEDIYTPNGKVTDAYTVAKMLQALNAPEYMPEIPQRIIKEQVAVHDYATRKLTPELSQFTTMNQYGSNGSNQTEPNTVTPNTEILRLNSPNEPYQFTSREDIKREIIRLRSLNFNQSQIIQNIWKVKKGASNKYSEALAEYKTLLEEIVKNA